MAPSPRAELESRLQAEAAVFQSIQTEYSKVVRNRTQLESQFKENEEVAKEFTLLKNDATIYKLIGPVLVKQETPEAVSNVGKRIEYIKGEIKRMEVRIAELEEKQEKKKLEIVKLQGALQAQAPAQGAAMPKAVAA